MSNKIQFRRGADSRRSTVTPSAGEPIWATDSKKLYIGDGSTAGGIDIFSSLGNAIHKNAGTSANNVLLLNGAGKIPDNVLPSLSISDTFEVANQSAMLALNAQKGDLAIRSDENKCYILNAHPANSLANWKLLKTPTDNVLSVNGKTGALSLAKSDVGLSNVENYSKAQLLSSPSLTGSPKAPTKSLSDNSTNITTSAWVRRYVDSLGLAPEGGAIDGGEF